MFLQFPFDGPEVLPERSLEVDLRILYSNSLLSARNEAFTLFVHVETAQPTVRLRYGLARALEAEVDLPFFLDYGGFLDGPIAVVEGAFGAENPQRKGLRRNVATFEFTRANGTGIVRNGGDFGLGDAWAGFKVELPRAFAGAHLAFRSAIKFPTGRLPFGSEVFDFGVGFLGGWTWPRTAFRFEIDACVPSASLPAVRVPTGPYGALNFGLTQMLGRTVGLQLQASGHLSPLADTGLAELDDGQAYLLAGTSIALSRSAWLEAGVVENVLNPYRGADITFLLGLKHGP